MKFSRILHPFIDGELNVDMQVAADSHVGTCQSCSATVSRYRMLGVEIRAAGMCVAPDSLQQKIRLMQVTRTAQHRRRRSFRIGFAIAALLCVACGGALWWSGGDRVDADDIREVVDLHHRSELPGHLVDLATADAHALKPWFANKLSFAPWVVSERREYELLGARLDYCDDQRVAVIVLRYNGHIVNVVSYPSETSSDQPLRSATSKSVSLCGWSQRGMQIFVASDLPVPEMERLAKILRS